jgi:hypothetical protein
MINIYPKKDFVLLMIRDHLLCYRLLQGLEKIGFDTTNFDLYIGDNIFTLLGFGNSTEEEELFEDFLNWSEKAINIDFSINDREPLDELCREIYRKLKRERKQRKLKKG